MDFNPTAIHKRRCRSCSLADKRAGVLIISYMSCSTSQCLTGALGDATRPRSSPFNKPPCSACGSRCHSLLFHPSMICRESLPITNNKGWGCVGKTIRALGSELSSSGLRCATACLGTSGVPRSPLSSPGIPSAFHVFSRSLYDHFSIPPPPPPPLAVYF